MPANKSHKILTSADEIKGYMQIGDRLYQMLIRLGLPVTIINGRYYSHADNLDNWWMERTKQQQELKVPD